MVERVELSSCSLTQRRILLQQGSVGEDTMVGRTCHRKIWRCGSCPLGRLAMSV
ncbi:hypothetical protein BC937DRAFT_92181 [Endogone sp. FLAS-F59071]|nr:hypothetical protein BC937DRAFT_92181 [Endogone sp. FLAS-F59071]|eukprot:RUS21581.1 hypothetical protein BC937DRAFT_92181 [Endogone sp. FLAS-F59071]